MKLPTSGIDALMDVVVGLAVSCVFYSLV